MATTTGVKGFLKKVGFITEDRPSCWTVLEVERILADLGIHDYEFIYQSRTVKLKDSDQLIKILKHIVPSDALDKSSLSFVKVNGLNKLRLRCWQFVAAA